MVYAVRYYDEIRLWWDDRKNKTKDVKYKITINDSSCIFTDNKYYNFKNLQVDTEYKFTVTLVDKDGNEFGKTENYVTSTLPRRKRVDITKPPYNAFGNGKNDNTPIIQQALNDNPNGCEIYFPMGTYVCGKLFYSGDTILRFDVGVEFI